MNCKNCGEKLYSGQTVCIKCGASVSSDESSVPTSNINIQKKFDKKGLTKDNKLFVIILCALVGCIGAHNFYMGEIKKGIIKIVFLFFFGISVILAIIDLIKLITDKYECAV